MPIPTSVIAGYLGSGKTTLLNQLLHSDHKKKLAILVNDFGDVNIDQDLIESQNETLLGLTNGCICCSIGGALFDALDQIIKLKPRVDAIIIEASGIAEPKNIANIAQAEPDLSFDGSLVLVDASQIALQIENTLIKDNLINQIVQANLLLLTKTDIADQMAIGKAQNIIKRYARDTPLMIKQSSELDLSILSSIDLYENSFVQENHTHHAHQTLYFSLALKAHDFSSKDHVKEYLENMPNGLLRLKGFITINEHNYTIQMVGRFIEIKKSQEKKETTLVAIGLKNNFEQLKHYLLLQFQLS